MSLPFLRFKYHSCREMIKNYWFGNSSFICDESEIESFHKSSMLFRMQIVFVFHKLILFLLCLFNQQLGSTFYIFYEVKSYEISGSTNFVIMFLMAFDKFKI